jgi:hypothetical protein
MSAIDFETTDAPGRPYSEGCDARAYGKPRDANPYPPDSKDHAFWLDAWSYFDELNGGGPRIPADYSNAPVFDVWEFEHFFVVPVVEVNGAPTFAEWTEFSSGPQAVRAGRIAAAGCRGVIVAAAEQVITDDENFYLPIAIFGDVPEDLLGILQGL